MKFHSPKISSLVTFLSGVCLVIFGVVIYKIHQGEAESGGGTQPVENPVVSQPGKPGEIVLEKQSEAIREKRGVPEAKVQKLVSKIVDEDLSIEGLGQQMRNAPDEDSRRLVFEKMLSQLTVENARQMRRQVADMEPESYEYREFHYQWGKIGGKDAVLHGATTKKPDMRITLAGWASADPEAALKWFRSLPEYDRKNYSNQAYMMSGLVHGLTDHSQERGLKFVFQMQKQKHPMMGRMMSVVTGRMIHAQGVENVAEWTGTLPPGSLRAIARARVVWDLGKQDLGAAAAWVEGFAHEGDAGLGVEAMAKVWVRQDILGSVTWLESLDHGPAKRKGLSAAYGYWGALEPDSAALYLNEQPPNVDRDFAINGFISGLVRNDPETALIWAEEIQTKGLREAAMVRAGERFFRMDPQAASDWMEGVSLSENSMNRLRKIQDYHFRKQAKPITE